MKNPFEKIFTRGKARRGMTIAAAITTAVEGVEAQTNSTADQQFFNDFQPKWGIDMKKYPGINPAKAFEIDSYNKLNLHDKIEFTKQALEAERKNLEIDIKMGEGQDQIKKVQEEILKLEKQLLDLERQEQPSV